MNFVLAKEYRFVWPVVVEVPSSEKPGEFDEQSFDCRFRAIGQAEAKELTAAYRALKTNEEREQHEHDLIRRVVLGWERVRDEAGELVPFSSEALEAMLGIVFVRAAIYQAYLDALSGKAREKN